MGLNPTGRFSSRVADYIRYRPSYPGEILRWLHQECGLAPHSAVADVGSGTGLLSELFLRYGCEVIGVEPNAEMRAAGDGMLAPWPRFRSVDGRAESTGLPDGSVDYIAAGQAFHWFDREACRGEFRRVLRPGGWTVLVWNERLIKKGFLADYEALLLRMAPEYSKVDHRRIDDAMIAEFFAPAKCKAAKFGNRQDFDWESLRGRVLSSSYVPAESEELLRALRALYDRYGKVSFLYETKVYAARA